MELKIRWLYNLQRGKTLESNKECNEYSAKIELMVIYQYWKSEEICTL